VSISTGPSCNKGQDSFLGAIISNSNVVADLIFRNTHTEHVVTNSEGGEPEFMLKLEKVILPVMISALVINLVSSTKILSYLISERKL